jgi:tetratricopeptide (TPR) repeat protein
MTAPDAGSPPDPVIETIFDGKDLKVVKEIYPGCPIVVVSYTGRAANPPVKVGFGEPHLRKRGISAIYYFSKANHWWQTPELNHSIELLDKGGHLPAGATRVLYGSSMGGFAALISSKALKADRVIVYSPQYSINTKKVPFETRWQNYAARVTFDWDDLGAGLSDTARIQVICDPFFTPDMKHIELVEKHRSVERIAIPFAGHNTARLLNEIRLITPFTDDLINDTLDTKAFLRAYKAARDQCSLFWHGLSWTLRGHSHTAAAALAATAAHEIAKRGARISDATLLSDMRYDAFLAALEFDDTKRAGEVLAELEAEPGGKHRTAHGHGLVAKAKGDFVQYLDHVRRAIAIKPAPDYALAEIDALLLSGQTDKARDLVGQAKGPLQRAPGLLLMQARLEHADGKPEEAKETLRLFCRNDRRNPEARLLLARCWAQTGRPDAVKGQLMPVTEFPVASVHRSNEMAALLKNGGHGQDAARLSARTTAVRAQYKALTRAAAELNWSDLHLAMAELRRVVRTARRA